MILNILGAIMCCSFVGANTLGSIETSQEISFYQENKKLASYDDEDSTIEITASELNNVAFENLFNLVADEYNDNNVNILGGTTLDYNGDIFEFTEFEDTSYSFFRESNNVDYYFTFYGSPNYNVEYHTLDNTLSVESTLDIEDSVILTVTGDETYYPSIKSAIQVDIEANQSASMGDVLTDFISILVSGISTLATGIASGIVDMSKSLFLTIDSGTGAITGLSTFGGLIALFAGLALAIGITTRVYLWVTSLGKD